MRRNIDDIAGDVLPSTEDRFYWAHNTDFKLATGDATTKFLGMGGRKLNLVKMTLMGLLEMLKAITYTALVVTTLCMVSAAAVYPAARNSV